MKFLVIYKFISDFISVDVDSLKETMKNYLKLRADYRRSLSAYSENILTDTEEVWTLGNFPNYVSDLKGILYELGLDDKDLNKDEFYKLCLDLLLKLEEEKPRLARSKPFYLQQFKRLDRIIENVYRLIAILKRKYKIKIEELPEAEVKFPEEIIRTTRGTTFDLEEIEESMYVIKSHLDSHKFGTRIHKDFIGPTVRMNDNIQRSDMEEIKKHSSHLLDYVTEQPPEMPLDPNGESYIRRKIEKWIEPHIMLRKGKPVQH